jgi:small subunit ribosomal protein S6
MDEARSYLGMFIITPDKEESIDDVRKHISGVIGENSGNVTEETLKGKRRMAYPVKKQAEGIYYEVVFSAAPASIAKIKRQCEINTDILRVLIGSK